MGIKRLRTEGIVIHRAEVFNTTEYHFIVDRAGTVKELTPVADKAAHAVFFNGNSIGLAVFGCFASLEPGVNQYPTYQQVAAVVDLCKRLNTQFGGNLWVTGHSQLGARGTTVPLKLTSGHTCPGEFFPLAKVILWSGLRPYLAQ